MKLFTVMLSIVVIVGALVSGVVSLLLPKVSTGVELGALSSLFFAVSLYGSSFTLSPVYLLAIFCTLVSVSIVATQFFERICTLLCTSSVAGLVFSLSIDLLLKGKLLDLVISIIKMSPPDLTIAKKLSLCYFECYVPELIVLWFVVFIASCALRANYSGLLQQLRKYLR